MNQLIVLGIIVFICLVVLYFLRNKSENFTTVTDNMRDAQERGVYAADKAAKGVWTNPGLSTYGLNEAINQLDPYLATSTDRDYSTFFLPDPENAFTEQDKKFCKGARYPTNLPARVPKSAVGCGWWFHPTEDSVGVLGNSRGPLFTQGLPSGGTYYWNLEVAALREDFKRCKRITNCESINIEGIRGKCGWCDILGRAVPIDSNGNQKYSAEAAEAAGETACGEDVARTVAQCPQPEPPEIATADGKSCGNLGYASSDNSIRLYTENECTNELQGNWYPTGECLRPEGGSYSYDCRMLNQPLALRPDAPVTTCTPDSRGFLSRECLIQIALSIGFTKKGSIYNMLFTLKGPNENERLALKYLQGAGITVPDAVLGVGNIDKDSAASIYNTIYNTIREGKTEIVRLSAKLLAVGTAEFDPCTYDDDTTGPFQLECAQRAFRTAGCQPAGSDYPNDNTVSELSTKTWAEVNSSFRDLRAKVDSANPGVQDSAMGRCLGYKFARPPPPICTDPGMEHAMYSWAYSDILNSPGKENKSCGRGFAALVGFLRNPAGLRQINVGGGVVPNTNDKYDQICMSAYGVVMSSEAIQGQLDFWTDDGLWLEINKNLVINAWRDQAPTYYGATINLPANKPHLIDISWYENGGLATLIARNAISKINKNVNLPWPMKSPMVCIDFFKNSYDDQHGVVRTENNGVSFTNRGGVNCAYFGYDQYIQIMNPIRMRLAQTYTMMVWWERPPEYITSFTLGSESDLLTSQTISLFHAKGEIATAQYRRNGWYGLGSPGNGQIVNPVGKWTHYAVTFSGLGYGMALYVNGELIGEGNNGDLYADMGGSWTQFPDAIMKYIYIGKQIPLTGFQWPEQWRNDNFARDNQMNLAWFHIYDYKLTPTEMKAEMNYINSPEAKQELKVRSTHCIGDIRF